MSSFFTTTTIARRADSLLAPLARAAQHLAARDDNCAPDDDSPRCEKPFNSSKIVATTVGITAAVLILGTSSLLLFLHWKRQREEKKEDAIHFELDGEVDDHPTMGKPPRAWQPQGQQRVENPFEPERRQPQQQENPFEPGPR